MVLIRVVYQGSPEWKLMRIYDIPQGSSGAFPPTSSRITSEDWDAAVAGVGGVEQDLIDALGITEVQDMR